MHEIGRIIGLKREVSKIIILIIIYFSKYMMKT